MHYNVCCNGKVTYYTFYARIAGKSEQWEHAEVHKASSGIYAREIEKIVFSVGCEYKRIRFIICSPSKRDYGALIVFHSKKKKKKDRSTCWTVHAASPWYKEEDNGTRARSYKEICNRDLYEWEDFLGNEEAVLIDIAGAVTFESHTAARFFFRTLRLCFALLIFDANI